MDVKNREAEIHNEEGVKVEVQEVGAWIVLARGQNMSRAGVHAGVLAASLFGRAKNVRDVPHEDGGEDGDGAVEDRVDGDESGCGPVPEAPGEGDGGGGKDGVDEGRDEEFAAADDGLDLRAVGPTGDVEPVVEDDDKELEREETGEDDVHSWITTHARGAVFQKA